MKSKLLKYGFIGFGALVLYKIISAGATLNDLILSIAKISFAYTGQGLIITFYVNAVNNKNQSVLFNGINAEIFLNETKIGEVVNDLRISIAENKTTLIPISVNLLSGAIAEMVGKLISGNVKQTAIFKMVGSATVENIQIPLTLKYSLF